MPLRLRHYQFKSAYVIISKSLMTPPLGADLSLEKVLQQEFSGRQKHSDMLRFPCFDQRLLLCCCMNNETRSLIKSYGTSQRELGATVYIPSFLNLTSSCKWMASRYCMLSSAWICLGLSLVGTALWLRPILA